MAAVPMRLFKGTLPVESTTTRASATVPAGKKWVVTSIVATNTDQLATQYLYVLLAGTFFLYASPLIPASVMTLDCAQVLLAGEKIEASCGNANKVNLFISGVEMDA